MTKTTSNLGLYVSGAFYDEKSPSYKKGQKEALKESGFTTVINWAFHVHSDGSIHNQGVVTDGTFKGSSKWKTYIQDLKSGNTLKKVFLSFWGEGYEGDTYANIAALIKAKQHHKGGTLYNNFQALYENMGVDGIDLDYETQIGFDVSMVVDFTLMLNEIGFEVTFCPYEYDNHWGDAFSQVHSAKPNAIAGINLQCYDGGNYNVPSHWMNVFNNKVPVYPGLGIGYNTYIGGIPMPDNSPTDATNILKAWDQSPAFKGAFLWNYGAVKAPNSLSDYSKALSSGISDKKDE